MVPEFIVDRVLLSTLLVDKSLEFGPIRTRFPLLRQLIEDYLNSMESGFVSNNSQEFRDYLESQVGKVDFVKTFAVRIRPNNAYRLFVKGREIFK